MKNTKKSAPLAVYLMENNADENTVTVCRPRFNGEIRAFETSLRDAKRARWLSPCEFPRIGETKVFPYRIERAALAEYIQVCARNGADVTELEGVSQTPVSVSSVTTCKISVMRSDANPCGLVLVPAKINGDSDAVWDFLKNNENGIKSAVKGVVYDKKERGYFVPSLFLLDAYDFLSASENPVFDCSDVLPFVEIVESWGNSYMPVLPENPEITAFSYQKEDAQRILDFRRGLLALEMGLGKTLVALMAGVAIPGYKLVVCPASLRENWLAEITRFYPSQKAAIAYNKRHKEFDSGEISAIISDESHYLKAVDACGFSASVRATAFLHVSAFTEFAFLLTGTPLVNSNADLWNFLKSAWHPLAIGAYAFADFLQAFTMSEHSRFGIKVTGYRNSELLFSELSKIMVRRRMTDLPEFKHLEKDRIPVSVNVDATQYLEKIREYLDKRDNPSERGAALVALMAARLSLGAEKAKATVDYVKSISRENKLKFVIFTVFKRDAKYIAEKLGKAAVLLTGDESDAAIEANKRRFQDPESDARFCVCTYAKASAGHNLDAAYNLVLSDLPWTWKDTSQAESRIVRASQKFKPHIHYILANSVPFDVKMREKVAKKCGNMNAVIDNGEGDAGFDMATFFNDEIADIE